MASAVVFFTVNRPPPRSTLFPYTSLFRSVAVRLGREELVGHVVRVVVVHGDLVEDHVALGVDVLGRDHRGGDHVAEHRSEEHTSELQSHVNLVCRLLLEKKNNLRLTTSLL